MWRWEQELINFCKRNERGVWMREHGFWPSSDWMDCTGDREGWSDMEPVFVQAHWCRPRGGDQFSLEDSPPAPIPAVEAPMYWEE